jgi:hypothetical protein
MSHIVWAARRLMVLALLAAAYGWQDRVRGVPGPRVQLVLPLQEPSHQASVSLLGLVAVWLAAFAIAAMLAPARRLPLRIISVVRGCMTFLLVLLVQAVSIELVREAAFGFAWHAALSGATPYVAGACAAFATLIVTPLRMRASAATSLAVVATTDAPSRRPRVLRPFRSRQAS